MRLDWCTMRYHCDPVTIIIEHQYYDLHYNGFTATSQVLRIFDSNQTRQQERQQRHMRWIEVSMEVDGEAAEAVAEVLHRYGHQGVAIEQAGFYIETWE